MDAFLAGLRWLHVGAGFVGLAAFWVPLFVKKGGRAHLAFGKLFVAIVYLVTVSAFVVSVFRIWRPFGFDGPPASAQPEQALLQRGFYVFLMYLSLITFTTARHAVQVVRAKNDVARLRTPLHRGLALACGAGSLVVVAVALLGHPSIRIILLALSPIGLLIAHGVLKYIRTEPTSRMGWWYEHMGSIFGAGIAFHTAFAVFGAGRLFDLNPTGALSWVPWVAPAVVGTVAEAIWTRRYKRRFGDLPTRGTAAGTG